MKILHTADWHLGQVFYQYDRTNEHQLFLDWLLDILQEEDVDVLLVCGDVFDVSNPSAAAVRMFYSFLQKSMQTLPDLQVIITSGNHDSAARLEAPRPLLESTNIHICGIVPRKEDGAIDYEKLVIPLQNKKGEIGGWCMAIPFLRLGDYPAPDESSNSYAEGVCALYNEVYAAALRRKEEEHYILATGHLHATQISVYDAETNDRAIMGGVDCIPTSAFHDEICYTALGHIHKAQIVGGRENVRYAGSPLPLSFSERNYKHQVVLLEMEKNAVSAMRHLSIPVTVPLVRMPKTAGSLVDVLSELLNLEEANGRDLAVAPFLEVHVQLDEPEPSLRFQVENAVKSKYVRLARIVSTSTSKVASESGVGDPDQLLSPAVVLQKIYEKKYESGMPGELLALFDEIVQELEFKENEA